MNNNYRNDENIEQAKADFLEAVSRLKSPFIKDSAGVPDKMRFFKRNGRIAGCTVDGAVKEGNYKTGELSAFEKDGFSFGRALAHFGIKEVDFDSNADGDDKDKSVQGYSTFLHNGQKVLAVRSNAAAWLAVGSHEVGHFMFNHVGNPIADFQAMYDRAFPELCCDLFSFYLMKTLGVEDQLWFAKSSVLMMMSDTPHFPYIEEVQKLVDKFIQAGRA